MLLMTLCLAFVFYLFYFRFNISQIKMLSFSFLQVEKQIAKHQVSRSLFALYPQKNQIATNQIYACFLPCTRKKTGLPRIKVLHSLFAL